MATFDELGSFLRAQREQVDSVMRGPGADVVHVIAQGLRTSAESLDAYVGREADGSADSDVPAAIAADPFLTDRQRETLRQIYAAFRAEGRAQEERDQPDTGA